jgi:hypothetical protein
VYHGIVHNCFNAIGVSQAIQLFNCRTSIFQHPLCAAVLRPKMIKDARESLGTSFSISPLW